LEEDINFLRDSEKSFESYLKNYLDCTGPIVNREMKKDVNNLRRIIKEIKSFRERMEELNIL